MKLQKLIILLLMKWLPTCHLTTVLKACFKKVSHAKSPQWVSCLNSSQLSFSLILLGWLHFFGCDSSQQGAVLCGWCAAENKLRNSSERMDVSGQMECCANMFTWRVYSMVRLACKGCVRLQRLDSEPFHRACVCSIAWVDF